MNFDVRTCASGYDPDTSWHSDEDAAIADARSRVGPNLTQASITAHLDGDAWAIRHFTWKDRSLADSGWRGWIGDRFVGAVTLADLVEMQADPPA